MAVLRIDLQEGFDNDTVVLRADGAEVWRKDKVKTRLPVGVAESFEVRTARDRATIEVQVPARRLTASVEIDVIQYPYLGVSIERGSKLILHPSRELFRYM